MSQKIHYTLYKYFWFWQEFQIFIFKLPPIYQAFLKWHLQKRTHPQRRKRHLCGWGSHVNMKSQAVVNIENQSILRAQYRTNPFFSFSHTPFRESHFLRDWLVIQSLQEI